jgi:hypothetical protein
VLRNPNSRRQWVFSPGITVDLANNGKGLIIPGIPTVPIGGKISSYKIQSPTSKEQQQSSGVGSLKSPVWIAFVPPKIQTQCFPDKDKALSGQTNVSWWKTPCIKGQITLNYVQKQTAKLTPRIKHYNQGHWPNIISLWRVGDLSEWLVTPDGSNPTDGTTLSDSQNQDSILSECWLLLTAKNRKCLECQMTEHLRKILSGTFLKK